MALGLTVRQRHRQLTEATGNSCGPVAVGAVTGANHEAVGQAIRRAAAEDGEKPRHLTDTNFRHQVRAVELLGFELFDPHNGNKVEAQSILATVAHFFHNNNSNDLFLYSLSDHGRTTPSRNIIRSLCIVDAFTITTRARSSRRCILVRTS